MNDAADSSFVTCVKLVENHAPRLMQSRHALTAADRAKLLRDGSIISIAPPMHDSEVSTAVHRKQFGPAGTDQAENIAATEEILALGNAIKHGDAYKIVVKHKAHVQTVYKMVWKRRNPRGVWAQRSKIQ